MKLKDKIALVTGSSRGVGRSVALGFAKQGANVVVNYTSNENAANEVVETIQSMGGKAIAVKADVAQKAEVENLVNSAIDTFGRLDILVNNAGVIIGPAPIRYMAEEAWRRMMEINASGVFLCCHHALPLMIEGDHGGRIINMSSIAALRPRIFMSAYAASKAAVVAMTGSLALEVGEFGITANAILPGDIDTGMKQWGMQLESMVTGQNYEDVVGNLESRIPAGRLGEPDDVADLVAFLASDEAQFITGQAINLTGGRELT